MVSFELTDNEAKILVVLLKMAGDEFGNHSCNDFDIAAELQVKPAQARKITKDLLFAMERHRVMCSVDVKESLENLGSGFGESQLFDYFRVRVQDAILKSGSAEVGEE